MQDAFVKSFNVHMRDECWNEVMFGNLAEARRRIDTTDIAGRIGSGRLRPISTVPTDLLCLNGQDQAPGRKISNNWHLFCWNLLIISLFWFAAPAARTTPNSKRSSRHQTHNNLKTPDHARHGNIFVQSVDSENEWPQNHHHRN